MAYEVELGDRVGLAFERAGVVYDVKRMMGGLCFMVKDKMCVGVVREDLMVRLDPETYEDMLEEEGCRPMDFTGRPMKGFVYVEMEALRTDAALDVWIQRALDFNPKAKKSRKKKKASE